MSLFASVVLHFVLSSSEPKVKVSFSDQILSVVRRQRCRKLFTFLSSSPEQR